MALPRDTDITNPTPLDPMLQFLERALRDPHFSTDKAEAVMRLLVQQQERTQLRAFHHDMNLMQQDLQSVDRNKANPVFNSRYATLDALDRAARPVYTKYGFGIYYGTAPCSTPNHITVTCTVSHSGGHYEVHSLTGPVGGSRSGATPIQLVGIAVTYLRRYLLAMVLNLVTADVIAADNDGNRTPANEPPPENGDRWQRWLDKFAEEADKISDSDQAKALLERESAVKMITEIPSGPVRQAYLELRAEIDRKWATKSGDIEGL